MGIVGTADFIDRDDVRMVECGRCLRFLGKPPQPLCVLREPERQEFERDLSAEPCILSEIHFTHAARPEQRNDLIAV